MIFFNPLTIHVKYMSTFEKEHSYIRKQQELVTNFQKMKVIKRKKSISAVEVKQTNIHKKHFHIF